MVNRHEIRAGIARRPINWHTLHVQWKGVFENYARSWVSKNFWKVREQFGSQEDALAECALIFTRCLRRYERSVDNPAWFMAIFKRAIANAWTTYAAKSTQQRGLIVHARDEDDEAVRDNAGPAEDSQGFLLALLGEASEELRQVLSILATAPAEALSILFCSTDNTVLNRVWKRWAGISDSRADVVAELRKLLS